jgi:hypothetical protein
MRLCAPIRCRSFWFSSSDAKSAEKKAEEVDADKQQRDQNISIAFRRASNQDTLEMMKKKSKYWKPQLELTAPAASAQFGSFPTTNFASAPAPLPDILAGQPAFVSLVFREAFNEMNFVWARHIFESTVANGVLDSSAGQRAPATLYQVFAMEGMIGRMLSNTLIRNTRANLTKRWETEFSDPNAPTTATVSTSDKPPVDKAGDPSPIVLPPPLRRAGAVQWSSEESRLLAHIGSVDDALLANLDALNKMTCYVFLLDGTGRVRWRACGMPSNSELEVLPRLHAQLIKEQEALKAMRDQAASAAKSKRGSR